MNEYMLISFSRFLKFSKNEYMVIRIYGKFQAPRDGFPGIIGVSWASRPSRYFDSNGPEIIDFDNFETLSSFVNS